MRFVCAQDHKTKAVMRLIALLASLSRASVASPSSTTQEKKVDTAREEKQKQGAETEDKTPRDPTAYATVLQLSDNSK